MAGIQGLCARGFGGLVLSVSLTASGVRADEAASPAAVVRLEVAEDGLLAVRATIDGMGPFWLLLDTGANRSAVSTRVAASLGLRPVAKAMTVSPAGGRMATVVSLDSVTVGSMTKSSLLAALLDDGDLDALGEVAARRLDGILGQDFLLAESYTIDYQRRRLVWGGDPEAARAPAARLVLRQEEGRWLAAAPQSEPSRETPWLVPDSGATALVLFDRGRSTPFSVACCAPMSLVSTLHGDKRTGLAVIERFAIGPILMRTVPAAIVVRREADAPEVDGLLPLAFFRSATFAKEGHLTLRAR